jgi:hypothetical protein
MKVIRGTFLTNVSIDAVSLCCFIITHVWNRGPITTGYCMPLYFLYSLTPPPIEISFRAHTYVYVARVRVMLNASRRFLTITRMT